MTNEIIETVKSCLTLLIAILCLIFSKYRFKENKRYAVIFVMDLVTNNQAILIMMKKLRILI